MTKEALNKKIGERIVFLRTQKGWSQADLARACGKERQALEVIENGKVNPTIYTLYEISKGLDVPINELMHNIT
ncbi:MAG TPA: helix-turn-helix transcriptional regulator [Cytophagales bacterium]|nr:helix-turn-helix transcriptional regulator [Cytophagales bacterium]